MSSKTSLSQIFARLKSGAQATSYVKFSLSALINFDHFSTCCVLFFDTLSPFCQFFVPKLKHFLQARAIYFSFCFLAFHNWQSLSFPPTVNLFFTSIKCYCYWGILISYCKFNLAAYLMSFEGVVIKTKEILLNSHLSLFDSFGEIFFFFDEKQSFCSS